MISTTPGRPREDEDDMSTERPVSYPTLGRRLLAALALGTSAVAVLMVILGAVRNWAGVIVSLVGLLLAVTAGWYAVSRTGRKRAWSLVLALAALGALIAGLLIADISLVRDIATIGLGIASVVCAHLAIAEGPPQDVGARHATVTAATHPVLIMNPKSGGGKAEKFKLADECRSRGIEPIVLRPGDDLLTLAEDAIGRGADVVGMAGGDGSQALVASVAVRHDIPHVVIPAGTRNHFALDLGLDRDDVVGALDAFGEAVERRIDLATVNDRVFVNNASLGLYAEIVQSPAYRDAKMNTAMEKLPEMLGPEAEPLDLRYEGPEGQERPSAHMIQVSNDPYEIHHLGGLGTRARIDLGVLGIFTVTVNDAADARRLVALETLGQVDRFPGWLEWTTPEFRVDSDAPVPIGIDGEAMTLDPPLIFRSMPGSLRVRLPVHASGRSPAARARGGLATFGELVELVAGRTGSSDKR
jgi:diacylglycerol kinase family enzyme